MCNLVAGLNIGRAKIPGLKIARVNIPGVKISRVKIPGEKMELKLLDFFKCHPIFSLRRTQHRQHHAVLQQDNFLGRN